MTEREALKLALDFIKRVNKDGWILADFEPQMYAVITAAKEVLAQPEQEPVAFLTNRRQRLTVEFNATGFTLMPKSVDWKIPLYTTPPQPEQEPSCAECGAGGGHALYCVACAEKFVGGYKEQEPVATISVRWHEPVGKVAFVLEVDLPVGIHKVYTTPPQRTWVGLTDEEQKTIADLASANDWHDFDVIDATEAKLKEKNS